VAEALGQPYMPAEAALTVAPNIIPS